MNKNVLLVNSSSIPVVEIDTAASSAYVRFKRDAVAKTIAIDSPRPGPLITVDLNPKKEVIGVELVGVKEFNIRRLLMLVPRLSAPRVKFAETHYVRAGTPVLCEA